MELAVFQSCYYIQVQRLAQSAGLLGTIQNADLLNRIRDCVNEVLCAETDDTDEPLQRPTFLPCSIQVLDGLIDGLTDGTHRNDNVLSIRSAVVVEQLVVGADLLVYLVHVLLYNSGKCIVVRVACLASLEEDIRVLSRTSLAADDSGSAHACGMRRLHHDRPYHSGHRNPIPRSSAAHEMYGSHRRSSVTGTLPLIAAQ